MNHLRYLLILCGLQFIPCHGTYAAAPGRLFFTPEERRQLEQSPQPQKVTDIATDIRFDGMLWRKDRLIALWINRQDAIGNEQFRADLGQGLLRITDSGGRPLTVLNPGEHWPAIPQAAPMSPVELHRGIPQVTQ